MPSAPDGPPASGAFFFLVKSMGPRLRGDDRAKCDADVPGRLEERFESIMPIELDQGRGETRNVSASGMYFITDAPLARGMAVRFTLRFPQAAAASPFQLRGEARVGRVEGFDGKLGAGAVISHYALQRTGG